MQETGRGRRENGAGSSPPDPTKRELERIRQRILDSPELPMPEEERERARSYELRVAGPDQPSIAVTVDVEVGASIPGGEARPDESGGGRTRELELTPQVAVESPAGEVYFVAWNHVARTFALWLSRGPEPSGPGSSPGETGSPPPPLEEADAGPRSTTIDDTGESR